jgi:ABC-2 type transport system permease protein
MRGFWKLSWIEMKLFLREPMAAFFTLVFPLMLLFLFGSIYGNEPTTFFNGFGSVDVSVPAYTAMIIATTGLPSVTIQIASYREFGILRRLKATPLRPPAVLLAEVMVIFAMTVLSMALLIIAGKIFYGLRFAGNPVHVLLAFILASFSFFALGFVLASLLPSARSAMVVAMALFFPMLFLSGAAIPLEVLPGNIRQYAQVLPLTHVVTLLRGLWIGDSLVMHLKEIIFLSVQLVIGVSISTKIFKWM